jgi:hypothetical protein
MSTGKIITFDANEYGMKLMAVFVAQLTREGVDFNVYQERKDQYIVEVTGGF